MEEKYLSLITNFGCHWRCPYCVTKTQGINIPPTTIESLNGLEEELIKGDYTILSVSGGGDPLHNYDEHVDFYDRLFEICDRLSIPIEMHTSYKNTDFPYEKCYRIVYHMMSFMKEEVEMIKKRGEEIIRTVYVESEYVSDVGYLTIVKYNRDNENIEELSIRQLITEDFQPYEGNRTLMKLGHELGLWYYIKQGDYNTYFNENKIITEFKGFVVDK